MRIVILGAGQVGGTLARNLANEDNDITLIDTHGERIRDLQHRLDIKTVQGNAAHPHILIEAGIEQADMLIAVTNSDEVNMIACQIAFSLFRTPNKIARIRSRHYYQYPELFSLNHIPIDVCISPEQLVMENIVNLIDYPGAAQVLEFCDGEVLMVIVKPQGNNAIIGKTFGELFQSLKELDAGIIALFRNDSPLDITESRVIEKGDELLFIATPGVIHQVLIVLGCYTHPNRRIIIAGGGHIGSKLAEQLENRYRIKIIDHNAERTHYLASQLHRATVLQGDIADRDLLLNENIEFTDVFCSVTNDDEANIMSSLQAKRLGTRYAIALVNRTAYVDLIEDSPIDHAISPHLITIGSILTKLRRGNMIRVHRLWEEAEAIELVIHGTEQTSKVIGRTLGEIQLPPSCTLCAVVRGKEVKIAHAHLKIEAEDHVILLLLKKRYIRQVETLFQVNLSFLSD